MITGSYDLIVAQICRDIADELPGGHKTAAKLAGVSAGVWSTYCNPGKPECSIPFKRALSLQLGTGRTDFSDLMTAETPPAEGVSPMKLACETLQGFSKAISHIEAAVEDGVVTPRESQVCVADLTHVIGRLCALRDSMAGARIGAVTPHCQEDAA